MGIDSASRSTRSSFLINSRRRSLKNVWILNLSLKPALFHHLVILHPDEEFIVSSECPHIILSTICLFIARATRPKHASLIPAVPLLVEIFLTILKARLLELLLLN